jgi:hypothetical protein
VLEVVNKLFVDNLKQSHGEWLLGEEQAMIPARRLKKYEERKTNKMQQLDVYY